MTDATLSSIAIVPDELESPARRALRRIFKRKGAVAGLVVIAAFALLALFAPLVVPFDPIKTSWSLVRKPPSALHWFGTDELGRDMFARVIAGSRDILVVAPLATLLGIALGTALGLVMGFFPGWVDDVLSRVVEAVLALPLLILALLALTALGASNATVVAAIGLSFMPIVARTVRAAVMTERNLDYVAAERGTFGRFLTAPKPTTYTEFTAGLTYKPGWTPQQLSTLLVRPEIRYDQTTNNSRVFNDGKDRGAVTLATDLIVGF